MCHAAATQELKRFIHIAKSDERPLEVLATKVLNLLRDEDRFDPEWSLRYAAAYASALSELGHHADILCTTALGYYARQTRKAVAAHEGQQKKLDVKDRVASFNWEAFGKKFPPPEEGAPDRAIGYSATPKHMLADASREISAWRM